MNLQCDHSNRKLLSVERSLLGIVEVIGTRVSLRLWMRYSCNVVHYVAQGVSNF